MYRDAIPKLLRGENLAEDEAASVMRELMDGKLAPAQIAAFLTALTAKGETADELTGLARVMRERATRVDAGPDLLDTCGTGGSGLPTTNTSTLAAFILAAGGVRVAKHGNRASSGQCGSMDVLEELGVRIDVDARTVEKTIDRLGIGFMLAPKFHPALAHAGPVRRELGFRTTFNFLGPLANPAFASMQVLGVSDVRRAPLMIETLARLGSKSVMVVHGEDGLDELTLSAATRVFELREGRLAEGSQFHPRTIELELVALARLFGGDRQHNARVFLAVLDGSKEHDAIRDLTALNAGAGFFIAGRSASIKDGFLLARSLLESGAAREVFERYRAEVAA